MSYKITRHLCENNDLSAPFRLECAGWLHGDDGGMGDQDQERRRFLKARKFNLLWTSLHFKKRFTAAIHNIASAAQV